MENRTSLFLCLLLLIACITYTLAHASHRKVHIPDELDDVVDDEEDDDWREWGKPKTQPDLDPPPTDFTKMNLQEMQEEMMKRQTGPVFGFVKLRPGGRRTQEMVSETAMKWSKVARTGAIETKFSGVDVSTIMFTLQRGQDALELKEFILTQSEAYEVKIGDQLFRRPGDPSFDQVFHTIQKNVNPTMDDRHHEL